MGNRFVGHKRISGRVAIVTGASRGIGRAIAEQLYHAGAKVVLAARDEAALETVNAAMDGAGLVVPTDVAASAAVTQLVERTVAHFGTVDILVNNAGVGITGLVGDVDLDKLRKVFEINVFGAVACIQAALPYMRKQGYGHVVNISSILGKLAVPQTAGYAASKFALQALSDGLRNEEAPNGVAVTVVCPGSTDTDFRANEFRAGSQLLEERPRVNIMSAERAAELTLEAIANKRREVILTPFARLLNLAETVSPHAVDLILRRAYHK